jgi:hypothetical protein
MPLWLAAIMLAAGLAMWLLKTSPAPEPPTTLHVVLPPLLLAFLLVHPRVRGLSDYGTHAPARRRLGLAVAPDEVGRRQTIRLAADLVHGRVGPVWLRCATAGCIFGFWAQSMGWVAIETGPHWMVQPSPDQIRIAERSLFLVFVLGATSLFAEHLALWERLTLTTRWTRRGWRFRLFWEALGRAILSQAAAAIWSFGMLLLLAAAVGLLLISLHLFSTYQESPISLWMQTATRARTELLLLILPGMLLRAWRELRLWREEMELRLAVLARELERERGGATPEALHVRSRRRLARGRSVIGTP